MSLSAIIALNATLDLAVIAALTWLMRTPYRLDRATATVLPHTKTRPDDLRRAA